MNFQDPVNWNFMRNTTWGNFWGSNWDITPMLKKPRTKYDAHIFDKIGVIGSILYLIPCGIMAFYVCKFVWWLLYTLYFAGPIFR